MKKKPRRYAAAILTAVLGILIAYPLSIGPAAFLAQLIDSGGDGDTHPAGDLATWFYWPIFLLPDPLRHWAVEWWNCGTRSALSVATRFS